ncbi:hypothetical protein [Streptomyces zaomyceticus]|uniref:hypothetical protein n=1 Tax=Streptomyces zaomyceticus TaxID=68286 RepID=UPI00324A1CE4
MSGFPGRRGAPATMPRGRYAVEPHRRGGPLVVRTAEEQAAYDGMYPDGPWRSDERGWLLAGGPRNQYVLHPEDVLPLDLHPELERSHGCCGPGGDDGANRVCACGAEVATAYAGCVTPYETLFPPAAVRVVPVGEAFGGGPDGHVL